MTEAGLTKLAAMWIAEQREWLESGDSNPPAIDAALILVHKDSDRLWALILEITRQCDDLAVLEDLGAGILEDLIYLHGEDYFHRIEKQYQSNPRIREALKSFWIGVDETRNEALYTDLGCQVIGRENT